MRHQRVSAAVVPPGGQDSCSARRSIRGPWSLIQFQVPEVRGSDVGARPRSFALRWSGAPRGLLSVGHVLSSSVAFKVAEQILASSTDLVARVVVSRTWNPPLVPKVIRESLLAGTPCSRAAVFDCGQFVDTVLIDLNSLPIGPWAWDVLFDVQMQRFLAILGSPLESELSALGAHRVDAGSVGPGSRLLGVEIALP